jgi:hypothetical protein
MRRSLLRLFVLCILPLTACVPIATGAFSSNHPAVAGFMPPVR